jgi:hypothetical protein
MWSRLFFRLVLSTALIFAFTGLPLMNGHLFTASAETPPVLQGLNSQAPAPGAMLTVTGSNFGNIATWTAVVELTNGEKFTQPVASPTVSSFKITVPNIYTGYNVTARNAEHRTRIQQVKQLYVKKGTMVSNRLSFNIMSPYPIIDTYTKKPVATAGDIIIVNGGNWVPATLIAPGMCWAMFEYLPGRTTKTMLLPPPMPAPPVPIPFMPAQVLVGMFQTKVPDVFSGKTAAEQDAISSYTGKLYIYGLLGPGFPSNSLDIKIQKKQANVPNPCKVGLAPYYSPSAPNRTMVYRGSSTVVLPSPQKASITGVKNTCSYRIQLSLKDAFGNTVVSGIWLNPGETASAFNGRDATAGWEAMGPESGSFLNQYPSISMEVSWK